MKYTLKWYISNSYVVKHTSYHQLLYYTQDDKYILKTSLKCARYIKSIRHENPLLQIKAYENIITSQV